MRVDVHCSSNTIRREDQQYWNLQNSFIGSKLAIIQIM